MADLEAVIANSLKGGDSGESGEAGTTDTDAGTDTSTEADSTSNDTGVAVESSTEANSSLPSSSTVVEDGASAESAATPVEGEADKPVEVATTTDDDSLAKELGLKPRADGKENRIPYSRVKVIIDNKIKTAEKAAVAHWEPQVKERDTKIADYEGRLEEIGKVEAVMFDDVERFVKMLPSINPEYVKYLKGAEDEAPAAPAAPKDMPAPDYELGNGQKTYGPDGLAKLLAWQSGQVEARVREALAKEYKPIKDAYEGQQLIDASMPRVVAAMEEAKKWEGFTENKDAILEELRQDRLQAERTKTSPRLNLESAYQKVYWPKQKAKYEADLTAARAETAKAREKVLAELKSAPSATSASAGSTKPAPKSNDEPRDLEDVIRDSVKAVRV